MFGAKELVSTMDRLIINCAKTTEEIDAIKKYQRAVTWSSVDRNMCKVMFDKLKTDEEKFMFVIEVYEKQ